MGSEYFGSGPLSEASHDSGVGARNKDPYMGPLPDPEQQQYRSLSPKQPSSASNIDHSHDEDTQPQFKTVPAHNNATPSREREYYQEPVFREHVTGSLVVPPSEAPNFSPAYNPYQGQFLTQRPPRGAIYQQPSYPVNPAYGYQYNRQQAYPYAYYPGYYGYYGYPYWIPYGWQQPQPKRDGYQLTLAISSLIASSLTFLTGGVCALFFLLLMIMPSLGGIAADERFGALMQFLAFAVAGLVGGGTSFYHSIRALIKKPSHEFKLPWFWTFLVLYLIVVAIATWLYFTKQSVTNIPLSIFLISLAGTLPALTFLALGVRRIHFPRNGQWPTTWRRFTLSLVSGATLAILLAVIFELILSVVIAQQFGLKDISLDSFDQEIPNDPRVIGFLFILVAVIAPVVEEAVKPLAMVALIGRIRSAAEAFILGMACGIGFDLVETTGYIGMGYNDWLTTALQRSSAGLLHGFGAGMVALGWYFITHPNSTGKTNRFLLTFGCWAYAILQHAIWNGSFGLQLLPAPIGPYLEKGTIPLGPIAFPSYMLVYIVESILMLIFFLYVTKKLRTKPSSPPPSSNRSKERQEDREYREQPFQAQSGVALHR